MMNRKEFYEYVKDNVKDYLPDSYQNGEIRIEEVAKNNGLRLTGISIPQGDQRAVPDGISGFSLYGICQWKKSGFLCG